ncbi:MAG TPA: hypothetical protein V6D14_22615 [Coleofasciculaceae cyanobacterium]|jgi:hypothetical protein
MSHFSLKTLTFYGVAIGSVVILFRVVSAYGETSLKAPPPIGGSYRISAQNLPECLKSDTLVLNINQSGVYLFGSLLPGKADTQIATVAEEKPSLTGRLSNNQQLSLSGPAPWVTSCNAPKQADTSEGTISVKIQGVVKGETLAGQIRLSSTSAPAEFTAQREAPVEQAGNKH